METGEQKSSGIRGIFLLVFAALLLAGLGMVLPQRASAATKIQGIDVSYCQGSINWTKVKKDGIQFVMVGTGSYQSSSNYSKDKYTSTNLKGANDAGLYVGAYHYLTAKTEANAKKAAEYVVDQLQGYKISYPVAVDIEDSIYNSMSKKKRTDLVIAFLEVIEDAGYYPAIYASDSYFQSYLDMSRLSKYDCWVAAWGVKESSLKTPYTMWQYKVGSKGSVSGISTDIDMDYSYKDYSKVITPRTQRKAQTGWQTDGTNYWYVKSDGSIPKSTFIKVGSKTYYVNSKGYRVTGWKTVNGKRYNFKSNGVMRTGWYTSKKKTYYLDPTTGAAATKWKTISGKKYYFSKSQGIMRTGWRKISGKYYYFKKSTGVMQTGWITVSGKRYYLDKKTGERVTGWLKGSKFTYYLTKSDGHAATGWKKIKGKYYYFSKTKGRLRTGFRTIKGETYYLDPADKGARVTGWKKIDGKWYYFSEKGIMQKNCKVGKYKLGADGVCKNRK